MGRKAKPEHEKFQRVDFSIHPLTAERLNQAAKTTGRKKSRIVDEAINEHLDKAETKKGPLPREP